MTSYSAMFQNILIMQEFLHHMTGYLGFVESSLLNSCMERKTAEKFTRCLLPLPELSCLPADAGRGKLLSLGIKKLLLSLTGADVHRPLFFGGKRKCAEMLSGFFWEGRGTGAAVTKSGCTITSRQLQVLGSQPSTTSTARGVGAQCGCGFVPSAAQTASAPAAGPSS